LSGAAGLVRAVRGGRARQGSPCALCDHCGRSRAGPADGSSQGQSWISTPITRAFVEPTTMTRDTFPVRDRPCAGCAARSRRPARAHPDPDGEPGRGVVACGVPPSWASDQGGWVCAVAGGGCQESAGSRPRRPQPTAPARTCDTSRRPRWPQHRASSGPITVAPRSRANDVATGRCTAWIAARTCARVGASG
jgi:hypothetical protein